MSIWLAYSVRVAKDVSIALGRALQQVVGSTFKSHRPDGEGMPVLMEETKCSSIRFASYRCKSFRLGRTRTRHQQMVCKHDVASQLIVYSMVMPPEMEVASQTGMLCCGCIFLMI